MENYNRFIADKQLRTVDRMIDRVPQPQMFGGKRSREHPLAGQSATDYADRSLAVNGSHDRNLWDDEGGNDEELGGKLPKHFWKDFGHGFKQGFTETMKVGLPLVLGAGSSGGKRKPRGRLIGVPTPNDGRRQHYQEGGAVWQDDEGMVHSTPRRRGGKVHVMKELKKIGKALKPVARELKPVAKEIFREIIVPEGKKMLKSYISGQSSSPAVSASGRRRRGGALAMDDPEEYHYDHYPKGLESYHRPKASPQSGGARSARGALVSKLMREKGMTLGEASKYIKQKGLM